MKISDNRLFKKDKIKFENAIEKIQDKKKQVYYKKIYNEFLALTKMIDENHSSFANGKIQPRMIRDDVKELQNLRYQLHQLTKS
jgi:hypothetical protein